jgi:hypothetical protein
MLLNRALTFSIKKQDLADPSKALEKWNFTHHGLPLPNILSRGSSKKYGIHPRPTGSSAGTTPTATIGSHSPRSPAAPFLRLKLQLQALSSKTLHQLLAISQPRHPSTVVIFAAVSS